MTKSQALIYTSDLERIVHVTDILGHLQFVVPASLPLRALMGVGIGTYGNRLAPKIGSATF
jgi:hypothetical protein